MEIDHLTYKGELSMHYHFIVNPNARTGLGRAVWNELEPVIKERGIEYDVFFTEYQRHATKKVREITGDNCEHTIIALGGDGTVDEVVCGICDFSKVTLGYIPIGSSNDFARELHIPTAPLDALELILSATYTQNMDVGVLKCKGIVKNFAVSSGIGFDAAVTYQALTSPFKKFLNKLGLGKLTYVGIALKELFFCTPQTFRLTLDDKEPMVFENAYFATAMNHPYEGGGFRFCPTAKTNDGILDVIIVSNLPKLKILLLLPTAFYGKHIHFRGVNTYKCRTMSVQTEHPLPVHTDGESCGFQTEITASLDSGQLRVIAP